jgi:hypothetical protein
MSRSADNKGGLVAVSSLCLWVSVSQLCMTCKLLVHAEQAGTLACRCASKMCVDGCGGNSSISRPIRQVRTAVNIMQQVA